MKGWWKDQLTGRGVGWLSEWGSVRGGVSGGVLGWMCLPLSVSGRDRSIAVYK